MGRYWFIANEYQCSVGKARFCYYSDMFHSINATQPVTYVRCYAKDVNATMQFPRLDQGIGNYPLVDYNSTAIGSQQWFDLSTGNGSNLSLSWVELPEADFGQSSIGSVVALPRANIIDKPGQVLACTIDARWAYATATVSFSNGPMMVSGLPNSWFSGEQFQLGSNDLPLWPQIKVAPEWAKSMNPIIVEPSISVFTMHCNSAGRLKNISMAPSPINAVESVLAVMLTESLARTSSMARILGSLKDFDNKGWMNEICQEARSLVRADQPSVILIRREISLPSSK